MEHKTANLGTKEDFKNALTNLKRSMIRLFLVLFIVLFLLVLGLYFI